MLDPVTLAVLKGRLEQIADEMDATLYRSAFNPIIAEAHDACHGMYDAATGATLIQGKSGLPVFVGAMAFAVKAAAKAAAGRGGMVDGDVWLFNDPYEGGTHANDFKLVKPVFRGGKLFCFLASAAHWHDVGGAVPGNYNPAATECWQEAVQIPPVRIVRAGVLDQDVLAILKANTRLPDSLWGDLNGQLAALELGARRLDGLLDEYGDATVLESLDTLRERARCRMANTPLKTCWTTTACVTRRCASRSSSPSPLTAWGWTSPARRRPARVRSTFRAPPPSRPATWRSSTCSRMSPPTRACWTRWT